ncbi:ParB/RepB/Spo0J family partition protein [Tabrizicola sp.]|uniref:ParB/RepB/Spo0J family partition protein n=1 Tax=Tabrizicola sp. TaxID=2005166 RepID=UPI0027338AD1|nr:ParB/RepB/Spo0J family partition protein [Tabrizicola sp.]MDP3193918.1 ParB/RepB/Spo0J family partition protein [Tabrizicola sp.]
MTEKRRVFDTLLREDPGGAADQTFPAGKVFDTPSQSGPTAAASARTISPANERLKIEAQVGPRDDTLRQDHVRLKRLGLVVELVALDLIEMHKLVRDRRKAPDFELAELKTSITELGLSNPIRLEARADGRFELIQGYRRLSAYRQLLKETGDADRYGTIPAAVSQPGDDLEALYRRMVDENLVRKDISFAEMAMLALDYAGDPGTAVHDPDKAVAVLFRSASYQKRSYIRSFLPLVERLGGDLLYPQEIPRALGLALARRLEEVDGLALLIRGELKGWDHRSVTDELTILRRFADETAESRSGTPHAAATVRRDTPAKAMASFSFDRKTGRGKCVAAIGRLEIQFDRDFTAIDRRRLEQALRLMLDQLD